MVEKKFSFSQQKKFGASSEKTNPDPDQLELPLFSKFEIMH